MLYYVGLMIAFVVFAVMAIRSTGGNHFAFCVTCCGFLLGIIIAIAFVL